MITVTTPTGNIGSQVVKHLLAAGEAVRVIARDPAKLAPEVQGKVEVVQGSTDDEAALNHALCGAESLFWVQPPSFTTDDNTAYYLRFARSAGRAVQAQGVRRVVAVGNLGRGLPMAAHAGQCTSCIAMEEAFERTGVDLRVLRCPGFMENMLMQLGPLKGQGMYFLPRRPDLKAPQVATRDIAASGARLLLDRTWTGQDGLGVLGPEDLSFDDMAAIMTDVLGKPIRYQPVPAEAYKAQLKQHGASEAAADGLLEMFAAKDAGLDNGEARTPENTTPTSFRQWCEEVLKPAFLH